MQFAVGAQQLQVERAFVLGDAAKGPPVAQAHGDCVIRRGSAARAAACRHVPRARIAQRLFDLGRRPVAPDIGQIRTQHAAAPAHHVATGAISFAREEAFTRRSVAAPDVARRDSAPRRPQFQYVRRDRVGFLRSGIWKAGIPASGIPLRIKSRTLSADAARAGGHPRCPGRGPAVPVLAMAPDATRLILALSGIRRLRAQVA